MRRQIMSLAGALALAAAAPLTSQALAQAGGASGANLPFVTQQSANEFLARVFIGQAVHNTAGERVGDINDLAFDRKGHISTVVIGVGGFLSIGEKSVGVPFSALTFKVGKDGERVVAVALTKQDLTQAPAFKRKDHLRQGEGTGDGSGPEGCRAEGSGCPEDRGHEKERAHQAVTLEARVR